MVSTNEEVISEVPSTEQLNSEIQGITEEDFERAQKTFQLGKKNLFLNKYDESVNNFGDACKIYSAKYGEMDSQCADIYYFYGRALLELARVENTVLGNALNGVPEETGPIDDSRYGNPDDVAAEEKIEISEKVIDALCENPDDAKTEAAATTTTETTECEKPIETTTEAPIATETATEETGEAEAEGEEEGEEEEEAEGEEEDIRNDEQVKDEAEAEDISNLQRSWEMFELAKLIFSKSFENDLQFRNKRIAECLLKLGEISIEQEIYEQAITDVTESIRLQEELEQRDERMLAESYYQLGLAQQFNNLFTEANETYQKSINIMQLRIEKLNGRLSSIQDGADAELERNTIKDEIAELEALIPEMQAKLEEVNEQGQQSLNLIKEAKECFLNSMSEESKTNGAANGDVKDITNLVKSKRKFSASEEGETTKKTRVSTDGTTVEVTETETPAPEPIATA